MKQNEKGTRFISEAPTCDGWSVWSPKSFHWAWAQELSCVLWTPAPQADVTSFMWMKDSSLIRAKLWGELLVFLNSPCLLTCGQWQGHLCVLWSSFEVLWSLHAREGHFTMESCDALGFIPFLFAALRAGIPTDMGNLCAEHMELSSKMVTFVKLHLVLF